MSKDRDETWRRLMAEPDFLAQFRRKVAGARIPFTGVFELTHRCNLRCLHCYGGDQCAVRKSRARELPTDTWRRLFDEAAAAGCMDALFTGGEPLLRQDFCELFKHAKQSGMIVSVFTSGTLINERVVETFSEWPPLMVEISIYGAGPETHDRITQCPGSFKACLKGVERLRAVGIRVGLKTVVMQLNRGELLKMEHLAKALGASWRTDSAVVPCLPRADSGGSPNCLGDGRAVDPQRWRVPPAEAAALECEDPERCDKLRATLEQWKGEQPTCGGLYFCGAGLTGFHLDPYGWMQPCLMAVGYRENAADLGFAEAWRRIARVRKVPIPAGFACTDCVALPVCSVCPALLDSENGDTGSAAEYICLLGKARYREMLKSLTVP